MTATRPGLLAGPGLGTAAAFGGPGAVLLALVVGAPGLVVGRGLDGEIDLGAVPGPGPGPVTARARHAGPADPADRGRLDIAGPAAPRPRVA